MPVTTEDRTFFESILPKDQVLTISSSTYKSHTAPWSTAYEKYPACVVIPSTIEQTSSLVKYLYDSNLDFAVRSSGVGGSSAHDVILSLKLLDRVLFDPTTETVEIGAGSSTGHAQSNLQAQAAGYAIVCPRCPYVGISGAIVHGGLSWLSHEFGLGSDPSNFVDAQVVLADGQVVWASDQSDLLWALRGGGGSFGVVTMLRLKAHKLTSNIWAGWVSFPRSSLESLSKAVANWVRKVDDPKMALHVMVSCFTGESFHGEFVEPTIVCQPYDGHGEAHAKSSAGFKWLLDVDGAQVDCSEMTYKGVLDLQAASEAGHGTARSWLQGSLVDTVDDDMVVRGYNWYVDLQRTAPELQMGTIFLLEVMMERCMMSAGSTEATAWPHGAKGRQHVIQLSTGTTVTDATDTESIRKKALKVLRDAPAYLAGVNEFPPGDYIPNFVLDHTDIKAVFGDNWDRLVAVKRKYDPNGRFDKGSVAEYLTPLAVGSAS